MKSIIKASIILSIVIGVLQSVNAMDHVLVKIESNGDPNIYDIGVITDEIDSIHTIYKREIDPQSQAVIKLEKFSIDDLARGVTLVERQGVNVITMKGKIVDTNFSQAKITLSARKNSLFGGMRKHKFEVSKNGQEFDTYFNGRTAEKLYLKAGTFGIDEIVIAE